MDISFLGMPHLNQVQNPFSSSPVVPGMQAGGGAGADFEALLRRAQNPQAREGESSSPIPGLPSFVRDEKLFDLCLELETILINNLIRGMRNTVQRSGLIDTGMAGEIFEDMLFTEYARKFARNANLGFAAMAYRELTGQR